MCVKYLRQIFFPASLTFNFAYILLEIQNHYYYYYYYSTVSSGIQVQNVQVCYLGIHVPWCSLPFSLWPPYLNRRTTPDAGMVAFQVEGPHTCCLGLCLASRWEPGHVWWRPSLLQPSLARSQRAAEGQILLGPFTLPDLYWHLLLMPKRYWLSWHQALF